MLRAGRSGVSHPMTVNEMVIALIRPKPNLARVVGEPAEAVAAHRPLCTHLTGSAPSPPTPPRSRSR
uniref:Uncharacterized protein SAMT0005 n=1 Tax=Streptomyces ambofaciens (strain ATCC 23877 / 3486 / DSM 40053 / JCM 4204 / NBRC 12836 / NRRL B-2516) TaxID=278992 RepID=Q1RR80_STRA7|nr:unknown hypothetical protein [Streptomyces ambofaciens ATCC 23877]CAI78208.1 unknown hypothetical protein [Streptomyces ambofaciens ATCC 23877]CAJ87714.1 hypothetical protein SAMT0005 [Streptomyces ambofaciens ATCC 23877]CAJ88992.1 hypothetical protein SAMT0005 [Streptomyces ambofaciens ATCC 23877]